MGCVCKRTESWSGRESAKDGTTTIGASTTLAIAPPTLAIESLFAFPIPLSIFLCLPFSLHLDVYLSGCISFSVSLYISFSVLSPPSLSLCSNLSVDLYKYRSIYLSVYLIIIIIIIGYNTLVTKRLPKFLLEYQKQLRY